MKYNNEEIKVGPMGYKPSKMAIKIAKMMSEEGLTYSEAEWILHEIQTLLKETKLIFNDIEHFKQSFKDSIRDSIWREK